MAEDARVVHGDDARICKMAEGREATVTDLYRVPENGKAEIVNGQLVVMTPGGGLLCTPGRWLRPDGDL